MKIALAGNPNSGKTTLFNALTGSNQYVGNWPGVTVEKKEGQLRNIPNITLVDLPGIYSLSPYSLEEVLARNYLIEERPDAILNIVDATNIVRNLYLTTQLTELGIPIVVALNMMDIVNKNGDKIDIDELSKKLGCPVVEVSALKGLGIFEAIQKTVELVEGDAQMVPEHTFSREVEHTLTHIENTILDKVPEGQQRWYSIKTFERDEKAIENLALPDELNASFEDRKSVV